MLYPETYTSIRELESIYFGEGSKMRKSNEPKIKNQIEAIQKQYKENLITPKEYVEATEKVTKNHAEWVKRNK
jgi:hypothetical protein